jgi:hypothetical protein
MCLGRGSARLPSWISTATARPQPRLRWPQPRPYGSTSIGSEYDAYREDWMRVEAVRKALFESAAKGAAAYAPELGTGMLRAADALAHPAAPASQLTQTPPDAASSAFLKLVLGDSLPAFVAVGPSKLSMLDLEATQVAAKAGLEGREETLSRADLVDAMLARKDLSKPLRAALEKVSVSAGTPKPKAPMPPPTPAAEATNRHFIKLALKPPIPEPPFRRLRIYAYDPGQQTDPTMFDVSVATVTVPWEHDLKPGPVGEYLESSTSIPRATPATRPSTSTIRTSCTKAVSRRRNPIRSFTSRWLMQ